jgi:2-amino-4-hydroxy-6-hydroxymethyldihydropteridine diphosphokinase
MVRAVLALGSNLGERLEHLRAGVRGLRGAGQVVAVSAVYETAPVGGPEQPHYLNAVVLLDTMEPPEQLLATAQALESAAGRVRAERWGARPLDIDVIAYGDLVRVDPDVTLPHPRAADRAFVLVPWLDVDADAVLPMRGPVRELAAVASDRLGLRKVHDADWAAG